VPKLNQIVAVVSGKKTRVEKEFGDLNKVLQKPDLFHGIARQYQPIDEGGEELPAERKDPQRSAKAILRQARQTLTDMIDAVATQEYGNCTARADVKVGGTVILPQVPVTVLLYLSKQLDDLHTFVNNVPLLDPSERWTYDAQDGTYTTDEIRTVRTKKVQKPIVLYDATEKHPAQTQLITEDVTAGHWRTRKYATTLAATERQQIVDRIVKLQDAVKIAREEANSITVEDQSIASALLTYVFGE
jgi:hypothetical protein